MISADRTKSVRIAPATTSSSAAGSRQACQNRDVVEESEETRTHRVSAMALEGTRCRRNRLIERPPTRRPTDQGQSEGAFMTSR